MGESALGSPSKELLRRAVAGDREAQAQLVGEEAEGLLRAIARGDRLAGRAFYRALVPTVEHRVRRRLRQWSAAAAGRDLAPVVEDFCQEVFVALFTDEGKALRRWDPQRGRSLTNFVGQHAEWIVANSMNVQKRNPLREEPIDHDDDVWQQALGAGKSDTEQQLLARDFLAVLYTRLQARFSERRWLLFEMSFIEPVPDDEILAVTGMTRAALHTERTRIRRAVGEAVAKLRAETPPSSAEEVAG